MNTLSRSITGIVMIFFGAFLFLLGLFVSDGRIVSFIYGAVIFILGVFIFLNTREDRIEQIKKVNQKGCKDKL